MKIFFRSVMLVVTKIYTYQAPFRSQECRSLLERPEMAGPGISMKNTEKYALEFWAGGIFFCISRGFFLSSRPGHS